MLAHRIRRWASIKPVLSQRLVFAGSDLYYSVLMCEIIRLHRCTMSLSVTCFVCLLYGERQVI